MRRPTKVTKSKIAHQNPFYKVVQDDYEKKGGKGKYYYIEASSFVIVIALDRMKKSVHMVKTWRYPIKRYNWEFTMGWQEKNETILMTAKRELLEETGMKSKTMKRLGWFHIAPGVSDQKGFVYVAEGLNAQKDAEIDPEIVMNKKITIKLLNQMVEKRKIVDAPTLIAIQYLNNYLKKK